MHGAQYVPQRHGQALAEVAARPSRARGQQMPPADVVPLFLYRKVLLPSPQLLIPLLCSHSCGIARTFKFEPTPYASENAGQYHT